MNIFDTSALTEKQRHYFLRVIDAYDYDWDSMLPRLKQQAAYYGNPDRTTIPVVVKDISEWGACGLSWPDGRGLEIDDQVAPDAWPSGWTTQTGWLWYMQVVMHELGHQAHFFGLDENTSSAAMKILKWTQFNGCVFSNPFARAFSSFKVGRTVEADVGIKRITALRELMGGKGLPPRKKVITV